MLSAKWRQISLGLNVLILLLNILCPVGVNSPTSRVKLLLWAWHQLKECLPALRAIVAYLTSSEVQECSSEELAGYQEEIQKLVTILESRLNFTLQQLVKSSASIAKKG